MKSGSSTLSKNLTREKLQSLNQRHVKGAFARSIASLSLWTFAFGAYLLDVLKAHHFLGISISVTYLLLINIPILLALEKITEARLYRRSSLFINQLEIFGYTAIIYFCGDIEATHITLIYAALIAYVGVVAPKSHSFVVASLCAVTYCLMFILIHIGLIPHLNVFPNFSYSLKNQVVIISVIVGFLYTISFISSIGAGLLKLNRDRLKNQNQDLSVFNEKLRHEVQLRIQAVESLKESEQQYRSLLESAPDSIAVIRVEDGCFVQVNECFCQLTGYSRYEALGKTASDLNLFVNLGDWERLVEILGDKGKINDLDIKLRSRDEAIVDVLISARVTRYHGEDAIISVITDITGRKQAEQALRESEQRFKTLTNNLNVGVYRNTTGSRGKFIEANPAIVKMFGFKSRDEFMKMDVSDLYQNPDDRKIYNEKMLENGFVKNEELKLRKKDGSFFTGSVSSVVVKDEKGKVKYYDGTIEDVSERKRLEAQIQQAQKMEAIGTLAGGIAHDFNNLLMAIQGNASLMLYDMDALSPHYQSLINIENSVRSGAKLTKQLLGYARKGKYQIKPIDLNQVVEQTSDTFGRTRKEIRIHRNLTQVLFSILADKGQIEQVLLNLFVNAADAMPAGGELFLKTKNLTEKDIKSDLYKVKSGNYVQLMVTDTGTGMDKKTKERIFEPFFTTKEMGRGTGLGLASVFGIIKGHGGYIDVESELGRGTTFFIYLPATSKKAIKITESPSRIINGNATILLVDDEELVLDAGSKILERLGYTVLEATDGNKAVEIYQKNKDKIDMVILDMIMPDIGGGEVYDRMKMINPKVRVLLSSGYSLNGQAYEILKRGCEDFIQKPFSLGRLSEKIGEFLSKN